MSGWGAADFGSTIGKSTRRSQADAATWSPRVQSDTAHTDARIGNHW